MTTVPKGFTLHPMLAKIYHARNKVRRSFDRTGLIQMDLFLQHRHCHHSDPHDIVVTLPPTSSWPLSSLSITFTPIDATERRIVCCTLWYNRVACSVFVPVFHLTWKYVCSCLPPTFSPCVVVVPWSSPFCSVSLALLSRRDDQ